MTNEQMNINLAQAMGWCDFATIDKVMGGSVVCGRDPCDGIFTTIPSPSTDPGGAMALLEWFGKDNPDRQVISCHNSDLWMIDVIDGGAGTHGCGTDPSRLRAISVAVLKAIGRWETSDDDQ